MLPTTRNSSSQRTFISNVLFSSKTYQRTTSSGNSQTRKDVHNNYYYRRFDTNPSATIHPDDFLFSTSALFAAGKPQIPEPLLYPSLLVSLYVPTQLRQAATASRQFACKTATSCTAVENSVPRRPQSIIHFNMDRIVRSRRWRNNACFNYN